MKSRLVIFALLVTTMSTAVVPPAGAAVWGGSCLLRVTVGLDSKGEILAAPGYGVSFEGLQDLDPTQTGTQSCVTSAGGVDALTTTSGSGGATSLEWSCAAVVGTGTWDQGFGPEGPPSFSARHTLTGSWGAWTLTITNASPTVVGVGHFTLDPNDTRKTTQCVEGISEVTMVGVLVFQDP